MTNFEKIKQMSVDEMAHQFDGQTACDVCVAKPRGKVCHDFTCFTNIKKWLESEAE